MTGHKQTTDGADYVTDYTYNLSGALIEQTYPSGRKVKNVIDNNGDLEIVQSAKCMDAVRGTDADCTSQAGMWNYAHHFSFNAAGAVTSMQLGNGRWESTQFNSRLQPTQIALGASPNATNHLKLKYSYGTTNNNGNVMSQTITVPTVGQTAGFVATQNYAYDSLNRLKSAEETIASQTSWKQVFTFDRYGNRNFDEAQTTTLPKGCIEGGNPVVCAADRKVFNPSANTANNRLSSADDYVFDTSGNTTIDPQGRTFIYDAENKQIEVKDSQQNVIGQYRYDGDGKRVKKIVPATGEVTVFVYSAGGQLVAEYSTEMPQDHKVSYTTADHLGSPRILTDENGSTISRRDFHPFGEEIATTERTAAHGYQPDDVRQKFTTYERDDETGLDFAEARTYANRLGRFTTVDPLRESARPDDPQTWNRFSYSYNNPMRFTDPSGMIAGDFYDRQGNYLGTDGIKDDRIYLLKKGKEEAAVCYMNESNDQRASRPRAASDEVGGLIIYTRTEEGADYTTGIFNTVGGVIEKDVSGVFLEPAGPDTTERNKDRRVPEGVYDLHPHSGKKYTDTFGISNEDVPKDRAIVLHRGYSGSWTEGCIMPGASAKNGRIAAGTSEPQTKALINFIKGEGGNVKLIIRNRIQK